MVNIPPGESIDVHIAVSYDGGFAGPVEVGVETPPSGISASSPLVLGTGDSAFGVITLTSAPSAEILTPAAVNLVPYAAPGAVDLHDDRVLVTVHDSGGDFDPGFGVEGQVSLLQGIADLKELPDGSMLVAGYSPSKPASICRLDPSGALDSSFASGGCVCVMNAGSAWVSRLLLTPDGIVFAGGSHLDPLVGRLTFDGQLDDSFGDHGLLRFSPAAAASEDSARALATDGSDLLVGGAILGSGGFLTWVTPTGRVDEAHAIDGTARLEDRYGITGIVAYPTSDRIIVSDDTGLHAFTPGGDVDTAYGELGDVPLTRPGVVARDGTDVLVPRDLPEMLPVTRVSSEGDVTFVSNDDVPGDENYWGLWPEMLSVAQDGSIVFAGDAEGVAVGRRSSIDTVDPWFGCYGVRYYFERWGHAGVRALHDGRIAIYGSIGGDDDDGPHPPWGFVWVVFP